MTRKPIYEMGSTDPIAWTCFSGIDIKISFEGDRIKAIQSLSFNRTREEFAGEISVVVFAEDSFDELYGKTGRLTVCAADDNDNLYTYFDRNVEFIGNKASVSVDDIVIEVSYTFKVLDEEVNE